MYVHGYKWEKLLFVFVTYAESSEETDFYKNAEWDMSQIS